VVHGKIEVKRINKMTHWTACSHCGAEISSSASFCRHCGSSDADGWRVDSPSSEIDSHEDEEFDYDSFVEDEFGNNDFVTQTSALWRWVAIALLVLFFMGLLYF
jgi:ribosomal protein L40E